MELVGTTSSWEIVRNYDGKYVRVVNIAILLVMMSYWNPAKNSLTFHDRNYYFKNDILSISYSRATIYQFICTQLRCVWQKKNFMRSVSSTQSASQYCKLIETKDRAEH